MAAGSVTDTILAILLFKPAFNGIEDIEDVDESVLQNHLDRGGFVISSDPDVVNKSYPRSFFVSNEALRKSCGKEKSDRKLSVLIDDVEASSLQVHYPLMKKLKERVQDIYMLTINCNHGSRPSSREAKDWAIRVVLHRYRPDIVFLQETPRKTLSYDSNVTEAYPDYFTSTKKPDARIMFSQQKFTDENKKLSSFFPDEMPKERRREGKQQPDIPTPLFVRVARLMPDDNELKRILPLNRIAYDFLRVKGEDRKLFIIAVSWHSPYKAKTGEKVKALKGLLEMLETIISRVAQHIEFDQLITVLGGDFNVSIDEAENQLEKDFPSWAFPKCEELSKRRREHNFDSFVMRSDVARQSNVYLQLPQEINSIHMEKMSPKAGVEWTSIDHDPVQASLHFM